jgi:hypothetical protein
MSIVFSFGTSIGSIPGTQAAGPEKAGASRQFQRALEAPIGQTRLRRVVRHVVDLSARHS